MKKILLAACAVLAMMGAARSEEIKEVGKVGGWALLRGPEHCAASSQFQNGTFLGFGVDVGGNTWMRITNPEWKIPAGSYSVRVQFDKVVPDSVPASASDTGHSLTVPFEMNETGYNLLTKGAVMAVTIGSAAYSYSLAGTAAMFPALLGCVRDIAKAANPFAGQSRPPAAPVSTPSNPFKRT
jgi:hypothetical protein